MADVANEHAKHAMYVHFSVLAVCTAFLIATIADTETVRTRAQVELAQLRLAIDTWNRLDRRQLREQILTEVWDSIEYKQVVAGLNGLQSQESFVHLMATTVPVDGPPRAPDFEQDFLARIKRHVVLKVPGKVERQPVTAFLVMDPIACTAGGINPTTLGDLSKFWNDLVSDNTCRYVTRLASAIEFPRITPGYELPVMGAFAYRDVMILVSGQDILDVPVKKADPHTGAGAIYPMEIETIRFGYRDESNQPYKTVEARLPSHVQVELGEMKATPLLRRFDPAAKWFHDDLNANFPNLAEVTRNYPAGISLADLDSVIRLEARRDERDFQALGLTVPRSFITAFALPMILALMVYLLAIVLRLLEVTRDGHSIDVPWIGVFPSTLADVLFIATATVVPAASAIVGVWFATTRSEPWWVLLLAWLSLASIAAVGIQMIRTRRSLLKTIAGRTAAS